MERVDARMEAEMTEAESRWLEALGRLVDTWGEDMREWMEARPAGGRASDGERYPAMQKLKDENASLKAQLSRAWKGAPLHYETRLHRRTQAVESRAVRAESAVENLKERLAICHARLTASQADVDKLLGQVHRQAVELSRLRGKR